MKKSMCFAIKNITKMFVDSFGFCLNYNFQIILPGINAYSPLAPYVCDLTASSMAGASSDQNEAAIITPAAKPSAISNDLR